MLEELTDQAIKRPRLRKNYNLHPQLNDPVQRLLNAMEPGTYVQPHRHPQDDKWELFVIIQGKAIVVMFDDDGRITQRIDLNSNGPIFAVEIPTNTWHSVASLKTGTVLFEVKRGPYDQRYAKEFATWAPVEGDSSCMNYVEWFKQGDFGSPSPRQ